MTNRFRLNLLAATIVMAGATSLLSSTPARAASFDGCSNLRMAREESSEWCRARGGLYTVISSSCSSTGYTLNDNCAIPM